MHALDDSTGYADLIRPPEFMRDGACAEHPDVEFFLEPGGDVAPAKSVCASCLVRGQCLEFALANRIDHGIWGGLSPHERRKSGQRRPRPARVARARTAVEVAARNVGVTVDAVNALSESLYGRPFDAERDARTVNATTRQEKAGVTKRLVQELRVHSSGDSRRARAG